MTLEQIMEARPSKEWDARFASRNQISNYRQHNTARLHALLRGHQKGTGSETVNFGIGVVTAVFCEGVEQFGIKR